MKEKGNARKHFKPIPPEKLGDAIFTGGTRGETEVRGK